MASVTPAAPVDLSAEVARTARDTSTPLAFMDKTTVSKIEAQGDRLMLTALVDQKGAILTDSGRRQLVRKICEGSEEHTSELQSLMRISYAVFCFKQKT